MYNNKNTLFYGIYNNIILSEAELACKGEADGNKYYEMSV